MLTYFRCEQRGTTHALFITFVHCALRGSFLIVCVGNRGDVLLTGGASNDGSNVVGWPRERKSAFSAELID